MIESLQIEITSVCNLKCTMCPVPAGKVKREKAFINIDTFKWIVDTTPTLKSVGLNNWGEPLLNPYCVEMVKYAANRGIETFFATNALFLNEVKSAKLINAGLNKIKFSIDAIKDNYNRLRIKNPLSEYNYNYIARNIEDFLKLNAKAGHPIKTEIVATMWGLTEKTFGKLKYEWEDKVDKIIAQPRLEFDKGYRITKCSEVFNNRLVILSDNRVTVCCADYTGVLELGKIPEQTIDEIFYGSRLCELKKEHNKGFFGYPCNTCTEYDSKFGKKRFE